MTSIGKLSLMVNMLRALKSGHIRHAPYFFKTITTGDEYGLVLGLIAPVSNIS